VGALGCALLAADGERGENHKTGGTVG